MISIEYEDVVELGAASEETKGDGKIVNDLPGSQAIAGILDD